LTGDLVREHDVKTMKDFSYCDEDRTFTLDVKNGEYRVLIFIGDRGNVSRDLISVSAEGEMKIDNMITTAGDPGNEVQPFEFNVTVNDGKLDLLFQDGGGKDPYWMVNALFGYWWSATENDAEYAWNRYIFYGYANVYRYSRRKEVGFSIRCVKN
jgi:uncharacterized protein (TIGR02145 family)